MGLFSRKKEFIPSNSNGGTIDTLISNFRYEMDFKSQMSDSFKQAYEKCFPLSFVIGYQNRLLKNAILTAKNGEVDVTKSKEFQQLLAKLNTPNQYQDLHEFRDAVNTSLDLYGNAYILFETPTGMSYLDAEWHVCAPTTVEVVLTKQGGKKDFTNSIKEYKIKLNGTVITVTPENLLHVKGSKIDYDNVFLGLSPLVPLQCHIENAVIAIEGRGGMMRDRGAMGILSSGYKDSTSDFMPRLQEERERVQKEYLGKYGVLKGMFKIIFSNLNLKWQSITMSIADLKMFEEFTESMKMICNEYGIPYELVANEKGSTFTNKSEAERIIYQDTIIPIDNTYYKSLSNFLGLNYDIVPDYSHLEIMQSDKSKEAEEKRKLIEANKPLYDGNIITLNRYLENIGEKTIQGGDVLLSSFNKVPLAVTLGVGGTQSLQLVLSDPNLTENQKRNTLVNLFGLDEYTASQMTKP